MPKVAWKCDCKPDVVLSPNEMCEHLRTVHGVEIAKQKYKRELLMHMNHGRAGHSYVYRWEIRADLHLTQSVQPH